MIGIVQWETQYNFALLHQLSASVTSTAIMTGAVFPNLTQQFFEITDGYVDGMTLISNTAFAPLVKAEEMTQWEEYSVLNQGWITESMVLREVHPDHVDPLHGTMNDLEHDRKLQAATAPVIISDRIFRWDNGTKVPEEASAGELYAPLWQISPAIPSIVNFNFFSSKVFTDLFAKMVTMNQTVSSSNAKIGDMFGDNQNGDRVIPYGFIMEPVYSTFTESRRLVGMLIAPFKYSTLFVQILPDKAQGFVTVIADNCGNTMTFEVNGPHSTFLAYEDLHDPSFEKYKRSAIVNQKAAVGLCVQYVNIYPSTKYQQSFKTTRPAVYSCVIALGISLTILFLVYDTLVARRQKKTMESAARSRALVDSLFPENVRERLMEDAILSEEKNKLLTGCVNEGECGAFRSRPIADFFPHTTLMCKY